MWVRILTFITYSTLIDIHTQESLRIYGMWLNWERYYDFVSVSGQGLYIWRGGGGLNFEWLYLQKYLSDLLQILICLIWLNPVGLLVRSVRLAFLGPGLFADGRNISSDMLGRTLYTGRSEHVTEQMCLKPMIYCLVFIVHWRKIVVVRIGINVITPHSYQNSIGHEQNEEDVILTSHMANI